MQKQREFIGRGEAGRIGEELDRLGVNRVLLVYGKDSYQSCGAEDVMTANLRRFEPVPFSDFTPNPTFEEVNAGVACFQAAACDGIVAVGGGSAIDLAKSVNALQAHPGSERDVAVGNRAVENALAPLIAIPTTAGTGSEATHFAVIYVDGKKYSLASSSLKPDVAIVDPLFTDTLPAYITACTGFDALCQAIESYWSVNGTANSRENASRAIRLLRDNLAAAVHGDSAAARDQVMKAANLSGKAIDVSKTTAPHALSYTITSRFGVAHGHAVALTLGEFFILHCEATANDMHVRNQFAAFRQRMDEIHRLLGARDAKQARQLWYELMQQCGLETDLAALGFKTAEDVETTIDGANPERLGNHPVRLNGDVMRSLFKRRLALH